MKIPYTYVPLKAVAPEDVVKCNRFQSLAPGNHEMYAWLPLNEPIRLIEPVVMRFFDGDKITLEGVVTLKSRGTPSSLGEIES